MAVFTPVSRKQCLDFLAPRDVGRLEAIDETHGGTQNTNYILTCRQEDARQRRYILTLFEQKPSLADLNFFLRSMRWMEERRIPAPCPVAERSGGFLGRIENRRAVLTTFLPGAAVPDSHITPDHCRKVGALIARMHRAAKGFPDRRPNDFPPGRWDGMFRALSRHAPRLDPETTASVRRGLDRLLKAWPQDLEAGLIHADIFPDNVFFQGTDIRGIIDFYYGCTDFFAYDLMVAVNAWCFDQNHALHPGRRRAMIDGYRQERPLTPPVEAQLPILGAGAAMRFLLTRLRDRLAPPKARHFSAKDPAEYRDILRHHLDDIEAGKSPRKSP